VTGHRVEHGCAGEHQRRGRFHGDDGGRPPRSVEHGQLADHLAAAHTDEQRLLTLFRTEDHLEPSVAHDQQRVAGIALIPEVLTLRKLRVRAAPGQFAQVVVGQAAEQVRPAQDVDGGRSAPVPVHRTHPSSQIRGPRPYRALNRPDHPTEAVGTRR
jgi:hypothetical protein